MNKSDEDTDGHNEQRSSRHQVSRRTVLSTSLASLAGAVTSVSMASAATTEYKAAKDGNWSHPGTWENGKVPTDGANVLIPDGVTVTVAQQISTRVKLLDVGGTLRHAQDTDTKLRAETIKTRSGSRYEIGTSSSPIQHGVTAQVEFIDDGPINEDKWPHRKNKGLVAHGEVEIVGAEKTPWTTLSRTPTAGDSSIELSSEPTNWNPGDDIVIPGVSHYTSTDLDDEDEERTISSIDGTTVTFDTALEYDHVPPKSGLDSYVLNLSRNIVFESENTDEHRRGHVMIMSTGSEVRYIRFIEMGRTNKNQYLTNPVRNEDTLPDDLDPNPAARYPLHWHRTGIDASEPHVVEGAVVDGSPGWGIVNHHNYAEITDSITYRVRGAGFVAEGGNERGSFKRNFALRSEGSGEPLDSRSAGQSGHGGDPPIDDFGHAGHGFWFQSPLVEVVDNVAAGHRHQAFVWWLRPLLDKSSETFAESTPEEIEDSRVTYVPNLPWRFCNTDRPLFEAIEAGRFKNAKLMRDTKKIPSTFAEVNTISGNTAFGAAGGVDFSRHNFKWKHERFSDFTTIDDMTVHSIGPFIDSDGTEWSPDLPRHRDSGNQGRGGNTGVSFRYTSNCTLKDSHIIGTGRENSVGRPFHDYLWTNRTENCTFEGWDWGIGAGEHRVDWIRNSTFQNNNYDVSWVFDNVGPTILDGNDLNQVRHKFVPMNQKASEVFQFDQTYGIRVDGRTSHVAESAPSFVPFPDKDSLDGVNNIEAMDAVADETNLVGLTNEEMLDEYGICIGGTLLPDDAVEESYMDNGSLVAGHQRDPPTSVHLDTTSADTLGGFDVVDEKDAAGNECLRWTGSGSPKDNPASMTFDCAAGTYTIYGRVRPDAWNGDSVYYRIDGGTWHEAEKLKSPVGFEWHDASPNGGEAYEWDLSEGTHTLEIACDNDGVLIDEVFVGSDGDVLGAYGLSQGSDSDSDVAPAVDSLSMSEVETKNADAEFDVSWDVSDDDGDLSSVDLTLVQDSGETTEDSVTLSVSGSSASGTTRLVAAGDEGTGNSYTVEATVGDASGSTASATASATESDAVPTVDGITLSEVETADSDAEFDASWDVSDDDGDLDSVDLTLYELDSDGTRVEEEDSVAVDVSGDTASGTTRLVAAGDDDSGNSYSVEVIVTDSFDNTDSATASATAATEGESSPTVDGITLSEVETDDGDAEFDASWSVSDSDGDLSSVDLTLTDDTDSETEDSASVSVSGDTASGTARLVATGDDGTGNSYTVEATATDSSGHTDSATASAGESENAPAVDNLAASEVETDDGDAEFDASWDVSDDDGDLASLELVLTQDSDGTAEDSATPSVSGSSASGTTRLVAAGDDGTGNSYTVEATATDSFDNTDSAADSVEEGEPDSQDPYTDHDLSQIEAEDFDTGGEGVAYHDTSSGNNGGAYRDTDVDIQETDDTSGGYNVAWIEEGEWWEYTVDVPADGDYDLSVRVAGKNDTSLDVEVDGSQVATVDVPNTGGWQSWTTVDAGTVSLSSGTHTIRLTANGDDFNLNWFGFDGGGSTSGQSPYTDHDLSQVEAEDFDTGGEGVAYHDTNSGNKGGAYRDTDVDIQETDDVSGDYNVAWIGEGEWWEYTVDVPADGDYDLSARLAGKNATSMDVYVDGSQVATVDVPNTGGWQSWTTVDGGTVSLSSGTHTIHVEANGDEFNFNWFGFE